MDGLDPLQLAGISLSIAAGAASLAISVVVLRRAPPTATYRAFALLIALLGLRAAIGSSAALFHGATRANIQIQGVALNWPCAAAAIAFISLYPRPRGPFARRGGLVLLAIVAVGALLATYIPGAALTFVLDADGDYSVATYGPLLVVAPVTLAVTLGVYAVGLAFARAPPGDARVSAALTFLALGGWSVSSTAGTAVAVLQRGTLATPLGIWGSINLAFSLLLFAGLVATLVLVGGRARREDDPRLRRTAFTAISVIGVVGASSALLRWLDAGSALTLQGGLLNALVPAVLGYALLRGQLLDLDVQVRVGIERGTIAALFIAVFLIVSQLAQEYFTAEYGWALGGISAGLLLFGIAPLQRVAERVATSAVPGAAVPATARSAQREDLYRRALRLALADRTMSREEERFLAQLSEELHVPPTRALALREEVEREADAAAE